MMNKRPLQRSTILTFSLAATTFLCVSAPTRAQAPASQSNPSVQDNRPAPQDDARVRDAGEFNRFLEDHPETSEQLRRDPTLINNRDFVEHRPELRTYMQDHPQLADQFRANPDLFMSQVIRFDQREDRIDEAGRVPDVDRDRMARFHDFCDKHPEIAEQVRKNPALLNDRDFIEHHDALRAYYQQYPDDRDQARRDPNTFVAAEVSFNRDNAARPDADRFASNDRNGNDRDTDRQRDFGNFLNEHKEIARDVDQKHDLVNDRDYVQNHRDLDEYLKSHPDVRNQWASNPDNFVKGAQQFNNGASHPAGSGMSGSGSTNTPAGSAASPSADPKQK